MTLYTNPADLQLLVHEADCPPGKGCQVMLLEETRLDWNPLGGAPSSLCVGSRHNLSRDEVAELVGYLQRWLETGSLRDTEANQCK